MLCTSAQHTCLDIYWLETRMAIKRKRIPSLGVTTIIELFLKQRKRNVEFWRRENAFEAA